MGGHVVQRKKHREIKRASKRESVCEEERVRVCMRCLSEKCVCTSYVAKLGTALGSSDSKSGMAVMAVSSSASRQPSLSSCLYAAQCMT